MSKPHLIIKRGLVRCFARPHAAREWARNVPDCSLEDFARMNRGLGGLAPRTFREWRNERIKIAAFVEVASATGRYTGGLGHVPSSQQE